MTSSCYCCCCSIAESCLTPCNTMNCEASLSLSISQSLSKSMSIESMILSNCLILCYSLLLLPSFFPSIRVYSSESALCIMWPEYWSLSFIISPSNECSVLISFRIDWVDLLAILQLPGYNKISTRDTIACFQFSSAQFSRSVVSNSLRPHESQHARPPCPSPTPGVYSNSCPLSR